MSIICFNLWFFLWDHCHLELSTNEICHIRLTSNPHVGMHYCRLWSHCCRNLNICVDDYTAKDNRHGMAIVTVLQDFKHREICWFNIDTIISQWISLMRRRYHNLSSTPTTTATIIVIVVARIQCYNCQFPHSPVQACCSIDDRGFAITPSLAQWVVIMCVTQALCIIIIIIIIICIW